MPAKYYAVKKGLVPGIYQTWDDCKKQVNGFPGAVYKSFKSHAEAVAFLSDVSPEKTLVPEKKQEDSTPPLPSEAVAYVDGSYDDTLKAFSYGIVFFYNGTEECFSQKLTTPELLDMRNVAGEIKAAEYAMRICTDRNIHSLDLYHDYEGIAKWCTGEWKANKAGTQAYKNFYDKIKHILRVNFIKVKGHSGDKYNDLADQLAKDALFGIAEKPLVGEKEMSKPLSIYLDKSSLESTIQYYGRELWGDQFSFSPLYQKGIQQRCDFTVGEIPNTLDFYFKADGSVTLHSVGSDTIHANKLKDLIIANSFKNKHENSNCTFSSVSGEIYLQLVDFLTSLDKINLIEKTTISSPEHTHLKFSSDFGDKLVINRYNNGTLLFQGNPAYILSQAMYFMTMNPEIPEQEIIDRQNDIYQASINPVKQARAELKSRIPHAYDKLDNTILKLLSPAISLSMSSIAVEEYSCYVFPVLKALEAVLLDLLLKKGIMVSPPKKNLGSVFVPSPSNSQHVLSSDSKTKINDSVYESCVERIYNYFKQERHSKFHANQILCLTKMVASKTEADTIISDVLALIDDVAQQIM